MKARPGVDHPGELRWETRLLVVITATLTVFGIASVYSASSFAPEALGEVFKQLVGAAIGAVALIVASRIDYQRWRDWAWPVLGVTLALLLILLLPGTERLAPRINGARRWLAVPGMSVQPSEIARFSIVVWAAMMAEKKGELIRQFKRGMLPVLVITGVTSLLVLLEPNLSMATIIALCGAVVLFAAGARIGQFMLLGVSGVFLAVAAVVAAPYRFRRFGCFFGIMTDCDQSTLWQLNQATDGFAAGRLIGTGFGEGQLKLGYLPMARSDFIFSTVGEEWGFLGVLLLLALFGVLCWLGFRIARTAADSFGQYLATGLTASIGITVLMHVAVNLGLMPTTGLIMPFISAGRSNLIMSLLAIGVIVSVGRLRGRPAGR
ncbi:MAG: FtsW/RodA/SpoVE family cell cycle protein [Gemmatimonadales bacterium]